MSDAQRPPNRPPARPSDFASMSPEERRRVVEDAIRRLRSLPADPPPVAPPPPPQPRVVPPPARPKPRTEEDVARLKNALPLPQNTRIPEMTDEERLALRRAGQMPVRLFRPQPPPPDPQDFPERVPAALRRRPPVAGVQWGAVVGVLQQVVVMVVIVLAGLAFLTAFTSSILQQQPEAVLPEASLFNTPSHTSLLPEAGCTVTGLTAETGTVDGALRVQVGLSTAGCAREPLVVGVWFTRDAQPLLSPAALSEFRNSGGQLAAQRRLDGVGESADLMLSVPLDQFPLAAGGHRLGGYVEVLSGVGQHALGMVELVPFVVNIPQS